MGSATRKGPPHGLWQRIQTELDTGLPCWRVQIESFGQVAAVERRRAGGRWSDDEVFEALLRSILSSATDWSKVERVLPELRSLFCDFSLARYAAVPVETIGSRFVSWFTDRRAGSMTLRSGLLALRRSAERLATWSQANGSAESYFIQLMDDAGSDPKLAALSLGTPGEYKLPGLGIPLAAEALKNLGFDLAKPDRHVNESRTRSLRIGRFLKLA